MRTVETAGKTVLFSALTVAASLAALLVFPLYFLRSFAYAGIAVVLMALARLAAVARRRSSPCSATASTRCPIGRRRAERAERRRLLAPHGDVRDAPARSRSPRRSWSPSCWCSAPVPASRPSACPTTGCCRRRPPSRQASRRAAHATSPATAAESFGVVADGVGADRLDRRRRSPRPDLGARRASPGSTARPGTFVDGALARHRARRSPGSPTATPTWMSVVPAVRRGSPRASSWSSEIRVARPARSTSLSRGPRRELVDTKAAIADRLPLALGHHRGRHVRAAVPAVGQRAGAAQGAGAQLARA